MPEIRPTIPTVLECNISSITSAETRYKQQCMVADTCRLWDTTQYKLVSPHDECNCEICLSTAQCV